MSTDTESRGTRAEVAVAALLVVVVAQMARVLFPVMFEIGEDWDFLAAGLVALAVFCAPAVTVPFVRLGRRAAIVTGSVGAGGALVVARLLEPIPAVAAMVLVGVSLAAATLVTVELNDGRARDWFVPAVVLGLVLDVAVRAVALTWDLPWQTGWASLVATLVLAGVVVAVSVVVGGRSVSPGDGVWPLAFLIAGALAALELLFLANIGFVASQAEIPLAPAAGVVLAGLLGALLVAIGTISTPRRMAWLGWPSAVAAIGSAWFRPTVTGAPVILLVPVLQVAVVLLFARTVGRPPVDGSNPFRLIAAATAGSVLFAIVVLAWQLHIDQPLPFPRQTIPALAAAVVAVPALRTPITDAPAVRSERRAVVAVAAALTVAVPVWLWATSIEVEHDDASGLRLVSYNVRGAVDVDGQLRPDRIATEIRSSDPDAVVLQEVGRGWPIHGTLDLLAYLSRELDMDYAFAPAADGQFGNAILSDLPMREIASGLLPKDGSQERSYLMVELTTPAGLVTVVGTHIQSRSVPQVTSLLEAVGDRTPVVIAGDMNIKPTDPEVALFVDAGLVDVVGATGDPCRTTSAEPTSSCDRPDWVFVTSDIGIDDVRIGATVASDHLAIHTALSPT